MAVGMMLLVASFVAIVAPVEAADPCGGATVSTNCETDGGWVCSYAVLGRCVVDVNVH
ncbi:MAG TPA: hypothetical protein VM681_07520 [Candidatus Thermoplasmatota archaeon]|nr:hypothetical protein [Candidatus Thermoplasmatota archaeon]